MHILPVTTVSAVVLTLLYVVLSIRVIGIRRSNGIGLGTGTDETLLRAVRSHGNAAEYIPLFLILLFLLEVHGINQVILSTLSIIFISARSIHAIGLGIIGKGPGRLVGMAGTFTALLSAVVLLVYAV